MPNFKNPKPEEIISFVKQLFNKKGGFHITNPYVYVQAFTHTSYAHEHPNYEDNEFLEFAGDELLDASVVRILLDNFMHEQPGDSNNWIVSDFNEAEMTELKTSVVKGKYLAEAARRWSLGDYLLVGENAESQGVRNNSKILENLLEALIAAVAIDSSYYDTDNGNTSLPQSKHVWLPDASNIDYCEVDRIVRKLLDLDSWIKGLKKKVAPKKRENPIGNYEKDPKSALNVLCTKGIIERPQYDVVDSDMDSENRQIWKCRCYVPGYPVAICKGYYYKKSEAEADAALKVLKLILNSAE